MNHSKPTPILTRCPGQEIEPDANAVNPATSGSASEAARGQFFFLADSCTISRPWLVTL